MPKLPGSVGADKGLELWLSLFKAKTEEELKRIETLGVSVMKEAVGAYRHVSTTKEFYELERIRSKARHDEAQALKHAEERGEKRERKKWEIVVADKDEALADKDAEIARLREQLEKKG